MEEFILKRLVNTVIINSPVNVTLPTVQFPRIRAPYLSTIARFNREMSDAITLTAKQHGGRCRKLKARHPTGHAICILFRRATNKFHVVIAFYFSLLGNV